MIPPIILYILANTCFISDKDFERREIRQTIFEVIDKYKECYQKEPIKFQFKVSKTQLSFPSPCCIDIEIVEMRVRRERRRG